MPSYSFKSYFALIKHIFIYKMPEVIYAYFQDLSHFYETVILCNYAISM